MWQMPIVRFHIRWWFTTLFAWPAHKNLSRFFPTFYLCIINHLIYFLTCTNWKKNATPLLLYGYLNFLCVTVHLNQQKEITFSCAISCRWHTFIYQLTCVDLIINLSKKSDYSVIWSVPIMQIKSNQIKWFEWKQLHFTISYSVK